MPAPPQPPPGYVLHELIGRGGQAFVYRATKSSIGKVVALKAFPQATSPEEEHRAACEVAAGVAVASSRHAVGIHHRTVEAGWTWLELEHCPGGSLADLPLTGDEEALLEDALRYGRQAALGLADLHEQGFVHRDVKPANLLLDGNGSVRLADFGIAARQGEPPPWTPDAQVGTLSLLAPELLSGGAHTQASDVHALGITLTRLCPWLFSDGGAAATDGRAVGLRSLVAGMTDRDPAARPTARGVAAQLATLGEPGGAGSGARARRRRGPLLRPGSAHGRAVAGVAAVLLAGGAAVAALGLPTLERRPDPAPSATPSGGLQPPLVPTSVSATCGSSADTAQARRLVDGDEATSWQCDGPPEAARITLLFDEPVTISSVGLVPGHGGQDFAAHPTVTSVRWQLGDRTATQDVPDPRPRMTRLDVRGAAPTTVVVLRILETGNDDDAGDALAIGEVELLGE